MSYRLNKTNGELVVELADGQIDTTSTDITLVGRNYRGFGEIFNENFIKIIENFANTLPPNSPLKGQLWYDTQLQRLKIYNGTEFRAAGSPIVSSTRPSLVQGDLWIDNQNKKLYFYDGNVDGEVTLVGPEYDDAQGKTGIEVESVVDINSQERVVIKLLIAGELFAVLTKDSFRLSGTRKILGYPDDPNDTVVPSRQLFQKGFNLVDQEYLFRGTAESALALIDEDGNTRSTANFLPSDSDATTIGSLTVNNSNGLRVGVNDVVYSNYKVIGTTTVIETQQNQTDVAVRTRVGNQFTVPLFIDSSESRIGIYNESPQYTLDINGDFRTSGNTVIDGDLTVNGSATYVNVDTLKVLDKNIELALLDDSTEGDDTSVDGAGITVRSTGGSKDLSWQQDTNSWTSNVNFNIESGNEYKINGDLVLSRTELGPTITRANGLSSIGTLTELNVDNITLDGNTLSTANVGLTIDASGDVSVSNSRLTNLDEPVDGQDAVTKNYVDIQIDSTDVALSLDTTGLSNPAVENPYNDVQTILESISPASQKQDGVRARIHCVSYTNTTISGIDIQAAVNKEFVTINNIQEPFDLEENLTAESVLQDVNFDSISAPFSPIPNRTTMTFEISGSQWNWQNTV